MRLLLPTEPTRCIPLWVGDGVSESGPRFGGRRPVDVYPSHVTVATRYLLTIRLSDNPDREASVFLAFDFGQMAAANGILGATGLIEVVVHGPSTRGNDALFASELSPHPLVLGEDVEDIRSDAEGGTLVEPSSKLGGKPYFIHGEPAIKAAVADLFGKGFLQVLQLDFPAGGHNALVSGSWPFADGMFHLLGREPFGSEDWRWFWEF